MNNVNYQKELDKVLCGIEQSKTRPRLLLHSCCAPCSSYCLVYLRKWFDITCYYYNPNITDKDEYELRINELKRLVSELNRDPLVLVSDEHGGVKLSIASEDILSELGTIQVIEGAYEPSLFFEKVREGNLALEKEGGKRCVMCFDMRLSKAYEMAKNMGFDYFTTSLTISPLKNARILNEIGYVLCREACDSGSENGQTDNAVSGLKWLPSDFKKKNGYKISVELCERYGMYRQNYCGCVFSQNVQKGSSV